MKLAIFGTLCVASYVAAETHYVQAYDTYFEPDVIYAEPGDTVIWQYVNGYPHTVTSGIPDPCPDGTPDGWFDGVLSSPGDEVIWEVPAEAPAEVTYYCKPHCMMGMTGTIYVEGDEPRLTIGIADISTCNFFYSEGSGQARIEIESGEYGTSSFAWGVEAEDMDINVDVVSFGNTDFNE